MCSFVTQPRCKLHHDSLADEQNSFATGIDVELAGVELEHVEEFEELLSCSVDRREDAGDGVAFDLELTMVSLSRQGGW